MLWFLSAYFFFYLLRENDSNELSVSCAAFSKENHGELNLWPWAFKSTFVHNCDWTWDCVILDLLSQENRKRFTPQKDCMCSFLNRFFRPWAYCTCTSDRLKYCVSVAHYTRHASTLQGWECLSQDNELPDREVVELHPGKTRLFPLNTTENSHAPVFQWWWWGGCRHHISCRSVSVTDECLPQMVTPHTHTHTNTRTTLNTYLLCLYRHFHIKTPCLVMPPVTVTRHHFSVTWYWDKWDNIYHSSWLQVLWSSVHLTTVQWSSDWGGHPPPYRYVWLEIPSRCSSHYNRSISVLEGFEAPGSFSSEKPERWQSNRIIWNGEWQMCFQLSTGALLIYVTQEWECSCSLSIKDATWSSMTFCLCWKHVCVKRSGYCAFLCLIIFSLPMHINNSV